MRSRTAPALSPSLNAPALAPDALGLYVHWPFCVAKCPYCDFNSHVRAGIDQGRWRRALIAELDYWASRMPDRQLVSIFFGGGTPSLMDPRTAAAVIDRAGAHWPAADDLEITLEANPSSAEAAKFHDLAAAGVNRLSLGLQALDDGALAFLGRVHDLAQGLNALDAARTAVDRVSIDLIYARPGQGLADWGAELERALAFGTEHLSLYQLTIEAGTDFARRARLGQLAMPDDDLAADLFALTQEMTGAAGRPAYEISNHARPGAESRHNLIYWRGQAYVGIGPGAHGRVDEADGWRACVAERLPERWLAAVETRGHGLAGDTPVDPVERARERLMMGLRLRQGVALDGLDTVIDAVALADLEGLGLVVCDQGRLALTAAGRPLLDAVLRRLMK